MAVGKNLENGEKTSYTYNALGMRTNLTQTLLGKDAFKTREISYLPDYLNGTANDLMAYEQGFGITRTIYGNGYTRLSQKVTAFGAGEGEAGSGTGAVPSETLIGTEVIGKTYFQPDIYGSPLFASNEQGQVLRYAERNIWGDLKLPVHYDLNISGIEDSLRFTSYAYDPVIGKYFAQARFYDSRQGRMLSKDPIKRDINGYPYCNNDPVKAIVGAVKGAVVGSGVGLPLAIAADFAAGTIGSAVEQGISEGVVDAGKSIAGGLTNAVNGLIYGNGALQSLKEAAKKGAKSGMFTSGINYLADVMSPQFRAVRNPRIQYQGGADGMLRPRDPKRGCVPSDPGIGSLRYGRDYGYQYNVPVSNEESQSRRGFSLWDFGKEVVLGAVTGGMAGATFYGAGRAVSALKESIKGGSNRYINGQRTSRFHELTEEEIANLKEDIRAIGADENSFIFNQGNRTNFFDPDGKIYVRGDVLPDLNSTHPRDLMSSRAVLAHEYYGHKVAFDKYGYLDSFPVAGSWNDEFRASYNAALNTPNLSDFDRMYLMSDALERAKEAGVNIKITDVIRRIIYGY